MKELPNDILKLLDQYEASVLLKRHLTLVYNTGIEIMAKLSETWPDLKILEKEVLFGLATHDIGKVIEDKELYHNGNLHETTGYELLINNGISENLARFTKTHGSWLHKDLNIEDLIVTLADIIWSGKRIDELEERLSKEISKIIDADYWEVNMKLDTIISDISIGADERLSWQNKLE